MKNIYFLFLIAIPIIAGIAFAEIDYTVSNSISSAADPTTIKIQSDISQINAKLSTIQNEMLVSSDVAIIKKELEEKLIEISGKVIAMQLISLFFFFLGLLCAFLILKAKKMV